MAKDKITINPITEVKSVLEAYSQKTEELEIKPEDFDALESAVNDMKKAIDEAAATVKQFATDVFAPDVWQDEGAADTLSQRNATLETSLTEHSNEVDGLLKDIGTYKESYTESQTASQTAAQANMN